MVFSRSELYIQALILLLFYDPIIVGVSALGSMSSIAVSYGENGAAFCVLSSDTARRAECSGADASILYGAPFLPLLGLAGGDSFVCGLLLDSSQPYCWGSNLYVKIGVPQPMDETAAYSEISAGDHHLCALRKSAKGSQRGNSIIDCWGYNMTASHQFKGPVLAITAGSEFNCGLFARNRTAFCWGDETGSGIIRMVPTSFRFREISAGGFHVCGVLENLQVFCWGRSLGISGDLGRGSVESVPMDSMVSVVGGRFHACGIKSVDRRVICWGFTLQNSVPPPKQAMVYAIAAGDYFTCGVLAESSLSPVCWGTGNLRAIPTAVLPGSCSSNPCSPGFYQFTDRESPDGKPCKPASSRICLPCSSSCPEDAYQLTPCSSTSDRLCGFNCSSCGSPQCSSFCSSKEGSKHHWSLSSLQLPIFVAELIFAVVLLISVSSVAFFCLRYKRRNCNCSATASNTSKTRTRSRSFHNESTRIRPDMEELRIRRARIFTYEELESATVGFSEESQVGKGSFSCVFKGVLRDGTIVAVKRAIMASGVKKNSKEFHTELDLLSRLNHAHLLNLLGYCEEGDESLLVYEFMANGSLYQQLHGKEKSKFDWVRRVTIAVQAARGIEYLHGYACPPVIHRDIKSSNILIDEENNARVADFGLSLLGPTDSGSPLSELPAGTLGYLDPEYYRLHYLTTKSDVYSFGVLLLEILSGRKAIDMQFEEGNIVEWAVPLIKSGDFVKILDPILALPADLEALNRISAVSCRCVRMRGRDRPSMDRVTTALERALAMLMGGPCVEQPILPSEVVLGSSRLHNKASVRSWNQSSSENEMADGEDQRVECAAPSWITFPSVTSSQRVSEGDNDGKSLEGRNLGNEGKGDSLRCLEEEIGPASPPQEEDLYLQHNF